MREGRRDLDLAPESVGTDGRSDILIEQLDGDGLAGVAIGRQINDGHAATSELALDGVAASKRTWEIFRRYAQRMLRLRVTSQTYGAMGARARRMAHRAADVSLCTTTPRTFTLFFLVTNTAEQVHRATHRATRSGNWMCVRSAPRTPSYPIASLCSRP